MKTLIHSGAVVTMNDKCQIYDPGYIVIEDNFIKTVQNGKPGQDIIEQVDEVIDAVNQAVIPGLVNAHTHLFQTFIRGLADDKPLGEWLKTVIWPVAANMGPNEARLSALLGYVENIRSGATSIIDNQYLHNTPDMDDIYCKAAEDTGVRLLMARGWGDLTPHPTIRESPEAILRHLGALLARWNNDPESRVRVQVSPLNTHGCSSDTIKASHALAMEWQTGFHIHVAEARAVVDRCLSEKNMTEIEWLDSLGCLGPETQLVHAVWLTDNDIDLIARRGAKVVHCPVSNMYLADGVAPIPKLRTADITIALATDGPGSNNNQDMMEVLKTTALLQKVSTLDAMVLQPEDIMWMACRGGAIVFGQPQSIGSLEAGKKADVVLVDLDTPFAVPVYRVPSALVYNLNGGHVNTVIIDGKTIMKDRVITVIDEPALLQECRQAGHALMKRSGILS